MLRHTLRPPISKSAQFSCRIRHAQTCRRGDPTLKTHRGRLTQFELAISVSIVVVVALLLVGIIKVFERLGRPAEGQWDDRTAYSSRRVSAPGREAPRFRARMPVMDLSGFRALADTLPDWGPEASFEDISKSWRGAAHRGIDRIDQRLAGTDQSPTARVTLSISKVALLHSGGETDEAYRVLEELRSTVERDHELAQAALGTVIYYQGVTAMRRGENENCIMCRGESSCIIPIARPRFIPIPLEAGWRSSTSPSTSISIPTISRSDGS